MTPTYGRSPGLLRGLGRLIAIAFTSYAASWRVRGRGRFCEQLEALEREPVLIGFWHGRYLPLFVALRGVNARVLVAEGSRGEIIKTIATVFGFEPVMLPRGNRRAATKAIRASIEPGMPLASAFDGALGPPRSVKRTLVQLASESGATVLPISAVSKPRFALSWRWDRREFPMPFASVEIRTGPPITVPRDLSGEALEAFLLHLGSELDDLEAAPPGHPRDTAPPSKAPTSP